MALKKLLESFRSPEPSPFVRVVLVAEVAVLALLVMGCIWLWPGKGQMPWYRIVLLISAAAFPICANLLHGERFRDVGLRFDNFWASAREVALATLAMVAVVLVVSLWGDGFHAKSASRTFSRMAECLGVAFCQQFLLQAFMVRRLRQAGLSASIAVLIAAAIFAAVHSPNWVLVGLTFPAGLVWCVLFLRKGKANLITLSMSHAVLSLLVYHAWPKAWHLALAVGPKAIERAAKYAQLYGG